MVTYVIIYVILRREVVSGVRVHIWVISHGPPIAVAILSYYGRAESRRLQKLQGPWL